MIYIDNLYSLDNLYRNISWLKSYEDFKIIRLDQPMDSNGFILANLDVSGVNRVHYDSLSYSNIA